MEPERYEDLVEEYLDGVLPDEVRLEFEARLETDGGLRLELAEVRRLRDLAASAPPVRIPDDLSGAIRERLGRVMPKRPPRRLSLFARSGIAAAILLPILAVGVFLAGSKPLGEPGLVAVKPPFAEPTPVVPPEVVRTGRYDAALDPALDDWLVQAENAGPGDVERLLEEAQRLDLLPRVRERLAGSYGEDRRYFVAAEGVLAQAENGTEPDRLAEEAMIVACVRSR